MFSLAALLGGTATWLIKTSTTTHQTLAGYCLYSLLVATTTYGILGATGVVKGKSWRFGGSAAIFFTSLVLLVNLGTKIEDGFTITGTLLLEEFPVRQAVIKLLKVDAKNMTQPIGDGDDGQFKFSGRKLESRTLDFEVIIEGYYPYFISQVFTNSKRVILKLSPEKLKRIPVVQNLEAASTNRPLATYGFTSPPMLHARIEADRQQPQLEARFCKLRTETLDAGSRLKAADVRIDREDEQGTWLAVIDSGKIIRSRYNQGPYGLYRASVGIASKSEQKTRTMDLNYVFRENFETIRDGIELNFPHVRIEPNVGLVASNNTKSNCVSACLVRQRFDFRTQFAIRGSFLLAPIGKKTKTDAALDITLNERLSIIMGEDGGDSYSIKLANENVEKKGRVSERNKIADAGIWVIKDGKVRNYFEIRFAEGQSGQTWCSLYLGTNGPAFTQRDRAWGRALDATQLGERLDLIRFRLWRNGSAVINDVEVAELPSPRRT
jgi:hypothetical protein